MLALTRLGLDSLATLRAGGPSPDQLFEGLAAGTGLVVLAWMALAAACAAIAVALPAGSKLAARARGVARLLLPAVGRRSLTLLVSAALVAPAAPALAAGPPAGAPIPAAGAAGATTFDPGWANGPPAALDPGWANGPPAALDPGWAPSTGSGSTVAPTASPVAPRPTSTSTPRPTSTSPPRPAATSPPAGAMPLLDPSWSPPGRLRPDVAAETAVVVRRGDSLWNVAARSLGPAATDAEIAATWPDWFAANRAVIGPDPDHLLPGQRLRPPRTPAGGST